MSKYERSVWSLIYPDCTTDGRFDTKAVEKTVEETYGRDPARVADPSCKKCHGRGKIGTYNANMDTDSDGNFVQKPITIDDYKHKRVVARPLGCNCVRKFMRTALRLAESNNNKIDS
jgi:hypothetical protein